MEKKISYSGKNVYKNSILSVVYKGIGMVLSLFSAPLILGCLGEEKYGLWTSLLSVISWIYYLNLGIGNGLRIRLSESVAKENQEDSEKYISTSYVMLTGISVVAFIISVMIILLSDARKIINIPNGFQENVNLILIVAIFLACVNFVLSLINNILYAVQRASAVTALGVIGQFIFVICLFIYKQTGVHLIIVVAIIEGSSQLLKNIIGMTWTFWKYPYCRPSFRKIDFSYRKGILSFGIQTFVSNISSLILNTADNIIILQFLGAAAVTPYSVCYKYFGYISAIFAIIVTPLQSAYTMAYTKNDKIWIKKNLRRSIVLLCLFGFGTVIAALVFRPFSILWLHKELAFHDGLIIYTALYCILLIVSHTFSTFLGGVGRIKELTVASVLQCIINIPTSIILAKTFNMGVNGIILGSVISMTITAVISPVVSIKVIRKIGETEANG